MKGGTLIVGGNVGPAAGFMMQKGIIVVCGDAADGVADSMYGGTIYVGGRVGQLGSDAIVEAPTADEIPVPIHFQKVHWSCKGFSASTALNFQ